MANKPIKSIKYPGLSDTYTFAQIDTTLSQSGKAADAQAVGNKFTEVSATAGKAFPTDTLTGDIVNFTDGADDIPMKSVVVNIEPVQSGSGDPSPDNVRPISGWTGANVVRAGVNVWDEEWEVGGLSTSDGKPSANNNSIRSKNFIPCLPNTAYYTKSVSLACYLWFYDGDKNFISFVTNNVNEAATTPNNCRYMKFCAGDSNNPLQTYNHDISINYPATDHDYHPYAGDTYSITFPTEAGTVYGGELDVTNGVLTVDRAMVDFGTLDWRFDNTVFYTFSAPLFGSGGSALVDNTVIFAENKCEIYKSNIVTLSNPVSGRFFVANSQETPILRVSDDRFSDAASFKTAMDGVMAIFKLKESVVYHLTPTEIKSLLGDNNVWADTGDSTVEYRADAVMYIDKKLGKDAPMIATDNIVSGSYFMVGNNLYKATANIASGAAVVVGTNATAKTMAEALNEINA